MTVCWAARNERANGQKSAHPLGGAGPGAASCAEDCLSRGVPITIAAKRRKLPGISNPEHRNQNTRKISDLGGGGDVRRLDEIHALYQYDDHCMSNLPMNLPAFGFP